MKKSGTVIHGRQSESPAPRHLPLVDILIDTQAELQELVVTSGLKVLEAMLEEDRVAVCGPRYAHQPARRAYRAGHAPSEVVLGGRKVAVRRPRVRRDGHEVPLPSVQPDTYRELGDTARRTGVGLHRRPRHRPDGRACLGIRALRIRLGGWTRGQLRQQPRGPDLQVRPRHRGHPRQFRRWNLRDAARHLRGR